jgi:antitoxin component YwqK of YwqJK toxin-antitoxin module
LYQFEFFDNGNISLKCNFVNGIEEGPFEQYAEDGTLEYKGVFKNGEIV